ncbi:hypothetical protein V1511DRAFT_501863 [Dipodascopsis uninucleata]
MSTAIHNNSMSFGGSSMLRRAQASLKRSRMRLRSDSGNETKSGVSFSSVSSADLEAFQASFMLAQSTLAKDFCEMSSSFGKASEDSDLIDINALLKAYPQTCSAYFSTSSTLSEDRTMTRDHTGLLTDNNDETEYFTALGNSIAQMSSISGDSEFSAIVRYIISGKDVIGQPSKAPVLEMPPTEPVQAIHENWEEGNEGPSTANCSSIDQKRRNGSELRRVYSSADGGYRYVLFPVNSNDRARANSSYLGALSSISSSLEKKTKSSQHRSLDSSKSGIRILSFAADICFGAKHYSSLTLRRVARALHKFVSSVLKVLGAVGKKIKFYLLCTILCCTVYLTEPF